MVVGLVKVIEASNGQASNPTQALAWPWPNRLPFVSKTRIVTFCEVTFALPVILAGDEIAVLCAGELIWMPSFLISRPSSGPVAGWFCAFAVFWF